MIFSVVGNSIRVVYFTLARIGMMSCYNKRTMEAGLWGIWAECKINKLRVINVME
jgi:hypothetical protein